MYNSTMQPPRYYTIKNLHGTIFWSESVWGGPESADPPLRDDLHHLFEQAY